MTISWPNKSPEPTAVGRSVPLSRATPRVGGGSAFFVRLPDTTNIYEIHQTYRGTLTPRFLISLPHGTASARARRSDFWDSQGFEQDSWLLSSDSGYHLPPHHDPGDSYGRDI